MGLFSSKKKGYFVSGCDGFVNIGGLIYTLEFTTLEVEAKNRYKEEFPEKGNRLEEFLNNKEYKTKITQIPNNVDIISRPKPFDPKPACIKAIEKQTGKSIDELRKEDGVKYFEYSTICGSANNRHVSFIAYFE